MNYLLIYEELIKRGQNRLPFISSHCHHIIPRYQKGSNERNNLTYLTRQEHRIVHYCRWKLWKNPADAHSYGCLGGKDPGGYNLTNSQKEKLSLAMKDKIPWDKGIKRPPFTEEHKQKISIATQKPKTESHKKNMSLARKGVKFSKEAKKNMGREKGFISHWKGRKRGPMSNEHKEKISNSIKITLNS